MSLSFTTLVIIAFVAFAFVLLLGWMIGISSRKAFPRVRFTVRRLMILVATAAALLWVGLTLDGRRRRFARLANDYGMKAIEDRKARREGQNLRLYEKYIYAAHHPWLPVWPDPPESKEVL